MITSGEYPGDGLPKPVVFPNPAEVSVEMAGIRVVTLEKLIEFKLASGMTAPHRLRDLADVQDTIRALRLPEDSADARPESARTRRFLIRGTTRAPGATIEARCN